MKEIEYSDVRAEAFRAYECLYGRDAALVRCDAEAARRWYNEQSEKHTAKTFVEVSFCVVVSFFALLALLLDFPSVGQDTNDVMDTWAVPVLLVGLIVGAYICRYPALLFDGLPPSHRDDVLSHYFMSDAEIAEVAAEEEEAARQAEMERGRMEADARAILANFNDRKTE